MDKKEIGEFICYKMRPVYIGEDIKGFIMDHDDFIKLLDMFNEEDPEEEGGRT